MWFSKFKDFFFPIDPDHRSLVGVFFVCLFMKFLWFDLFWCMMSTFTPFSKVETYSYTLLIVLILLLPMICFRTVKSTLFLFCLIDAFLISNLMYFRTYFTAIPLDSYLLVGNLADFTGSVLDSFRVSDLFFPFSTFGIGVLFWLNYYKKTHSHDYAKWYIPFCRSLCLILLIALIPAVRLWGQQGFKVAYEKMQDAYLHTCNVPMYTLFGSLYYDYSCDNVEYTPEIKHQIDFWFDQDTVRQTSLPDTLYQNCIVILAESFESWVLGKTVEGQELTPFINQFLKESSTLYAPHVLSQVKGGRSIDAQLLVNAGLLPIQSGAFSIKFPESYYPSLQKAFKEKYPDARAYSLTVDKPMVWNQCVISPVLGFDSLLTKQCFVQEEPVGSRKQIGDRAFLRQCFDKISQGEVWADAGQTFLQCVTYSGHNPYILPDSLKKVFFSPAIPEVLNNYMTMANYTDRAIGEFVSRIRADKRFDRTLIVITGDHECLGAVRQDLCEDPVTREIVSDKPFTPLIVLNAPATLYYGKVMGQIDIYPTLLDLLGLNQYAWKGLGQSIFDPQKTGIAVDPNQIVVGDITGVAVEEIEKVKEAWEVSDLMIRYNYLGQSGYPDMPRKVLVYK